MLGIQVNCIKISNSVDRKLNKENFIKLPNYHLDAIQISNPFCNALISLQGGQILKFFSKKQNKDLLWLSGLNTYQQGKAIRGGIPLCFPWFGAHEREFEYPAHGFARNHLWKLIQNKENEIGHHLILELKDSDETRCYFPYAFQLQMYIHCGDQLKLELKLQNLDRKDFECSFAWHSYFPANTETADVVGLAQESYMDQLDQNILKVQKDQAVLFTEEIDRIYEKTTGKFTLNQGNGQSIKIKSNTQSAVIWNPWIKKSATLNDMDDNAWKEFICIENGQVKSQKLFLSAGKAAQFELVIS